MAIKTSSYFLKTKVVISMVRLLVQVKTIWGSITNMINSSNSLNYNSNNNNNNYSSNKTNTTTKKRSIRANTIMVNRRRTRKKSTSTRCLQRSSSSTFNISKCFRCNNNNKCRCMMTMARVKRRIWSRCNE